MKRPVSITILAWVFVVVGSVGLAGGLIQFLRVINTGGLSSNQHYLTESGFTALSGLIATIGGAGLLHGFRWARWVCILWMAFHVALSMFHSMIEMIFHLVMLLAMIYILFRKRQQRMIDA